jgi:hypothetical protein
MNLVTNFAIILYTMEASYTCSLRSCIHSLHTTPTTPSSLLPCSLSIYLLFAPTKNVPLAWLGKCFSSTLLTSQVHGPCISPLCILDSLVLKPPLIMEVSGFLFHYHLITSSYTLPSTWRSLK